MSWGPDIPTSSLSEVPGTSLQRAQTHSAGASRPSVFCPWCANAVRRKQDLKRHILSLHLPYWICCPHPFCPWRGTRMEELRKHMRKGRCGLEAKLEQYKIYEPRQVLDCVFNDSDCTPIKLKLMSVEMSALELVSERAMELQKVELWEDLWGRQPEGIFDFEAAS